MDLYYRLVYQLGGGTLMIEILIVDDQEMIRQSLELMLNSKTGIKVIGTAVDGRDAIRKVQQKKPDVILMDIRMPGMDGIECLKIIKEFHTAIKVIILTTFDDDEYIYESLKYGANGFLLKGTKMEALVKAIEVVNQGGAMMDPNVSSKVMNLFAQMAKADYSSNVRISDYEDLNNNELKIVKSIGQGLSNKEISSSLNFTEGTVRNYISSILRKLDLRDRTQIAIFAIQSSLMIRDIEE